MEARSERQRWTYAEFARLPTSGSTRYEVIDGELVVTPAPGLRHQRVVTHLVSLLHRFAQEGRLGEVFVGPFDVLSAEGDYMEPDIVFVAREGAHLLSDRGVEGPPVLVIEVTSPSTAGRDRGIKLERYRLFGVEEYWVVDPEERTVEVWRLGSQAAEPFGLRASHTLEWAPSAGAMLSIGLASLFEAATPPE